VRATRSFQDFEVVKTLGPPFTAKTADKELACPERAYRHLRHLVGLKGLIGEPHPTFKRRFRYRVNGRRGPVATVAATLRHGGAGTTAPDANIGSYNRM
jgi:hypothetical protein